jgi:hypothetical protein
MQKQNVKDEKPDHNSIIRLENQLEILNSKIDSIIKKSK